MSNRYSAGALVAAALLVGCPQGAWAGAWTVPRNRWYMEYFYRYFGSKHEFDSDGDRHRRAKTARFSDIRNEWKMEYGLTDRLNLLASVPYISSHLRDDGSDLLRTGAGDIYVRTKFRVLNQPLIADEEPLVSSVQLSWKIPSAYDPNENPIGDGQVDFESRLQLSQGWVFRPYEVQSPRRAPRKATAPASTPAATTHHESRELALREAILVAALYQRGVRFAEEGLPREAAQCFRAAAEGRLGSQPRYMTVAAEAFEPVIDPSLDPSPTFSSAQDEAVEWERRYAGVAFINLEGGFTARNEDPANEFPIFLEAGFTPFKRLMLVGSLDSVISVKSTDEQTEDFAKWGIRAILNIWGDGFASVFRTTGGPTVNFEIGYNDIFAGRNTADAFEIFGKLGISF